MTFDEQYASIMKEVDTLPGMNKLPPETKRVARTMLMLTYQLRDAHKQLNERVSKLEEQA